MKSAEVFNKLSLKRGVLVVAVAEPISTLPQIYQIWVKHQTAGVSALTWALFAAGAFVWVLYGLSIKDKPLIISSVLWVITELAVIFGVLFN